MSTTVAQSASRVSPAGATRFATPRFYWCVAILLASAVSMQGLAAWFEGHFRKEALPLIRPLYEFDLARLAPEYRLYEKQPAPLNNEMIEALGTREYLNWLLIDETKKPADPTRMVRVFITYYTGKPDLVPHEPRECMVAGGFTIRNEETVAFDIPRTDGSKAQIPVAVLDFEEPQRAESFTAPRIMPVTFFFWANGDYTTTRLGVRRAVANLSHRYAYYTKIEVSFSAETNAMAWPDREAAKAASEALLRKLMPVLWDNHYQNWDAILAGKPLKSASQP